VAPASVLSIPWSTHLASCFSAAQESNPLFVGGVYNFDSFENLITVIYFEIGQTWKQRINLKRVSLLVWISCSIGLSAVVRAGLSSYSLRGYIGHKYTGRGGGGGAKGYLYFKFFVKHILCVFHLYRQFRTSEVGGGTFIFALGREVSNRLSMQRSNTDMRTVFITGDQTVVCGRYQNLFVTSVRSKALRLTAFFGPTYFCEETFSQIMIIKTRHRSRLTGEHVQYCLQMCLSNYEPSLSKLSQDMQCHASTSQ
jgi:hypothetical protein